MPRLIISADVHGSLSAWITLKNLLKKGDALAVAGDLFDTVYGRATDPDFAPDTIRQNLGTLDHPFFYVYGNCDDPRYFPGASRQLAFSFDNHSLFMHHGHERQFQLPAGVHLVISGHTHMPFLKTHHQTCFFNPGSITAPRKSAPTFGILESGTIRLMELASGKCLAEAGLLTPPR